VDALELGADHQDQERSPNPTPCSLRSLTWDSMDRCDFKSSQHWWATFQADCPQKLAVEWSFGC